MFPDIIKAYADALYVATTLRPPVSAAPARESERFAESEERRRVRSLHPLASRVADWLRTTLGYRSGATGEHAASVRPSFIRGPHC